LRTCAATLGTSSLRVVCFAHEPPLQPPHRCGHPGNRGARRCTDDDAGAVSGRSASARTCAERRSRAPPLGLPEFRTAPRLRRVARRASELVGRRGRRRSGARRSIGTEALPGAHQAGVQTPHRQQLHGDRTRLARAGAGPFRRGGRYRAAAATTLLVDARPATRHRTAGVEPRLHGGPELDRQRTAALGRPFHARGLRPLPLRSRMDRRLGKRRHRAGRGRRQGEGHGLPESHSRRPVGRRLGIARGAAARRCGRRRHFRRRRPSRRRREDARPDTRALGVAAHARRQSGAARALSW
jgi:hypothetical protein